MNENADTVTCAMADEKRNKICTRSNPPGCLHPSRGGDNHLVYAVAVRVSLHVHLLARTEPERYAIQRNRQEQWPETWAYERDNTYPVWSQQRWSVN